MTNQQDFIQMTGKVDIICKDKDGIVKTRRKINNLVVQVGKDLIAAVFHGTVTDKVTHMALGSNSPATTANISQSHLISEVAPRVAITSTLNSSPANIVYTASFIAGQATGNVGEAGLFTASSAGTMVARTTFSSIPKEADDVIEVTWTITFG